MACEGKRDGCIHGHSGELKELTTWTRRGGVGRVWREYEETVQVVLHQRGTV